MSDIATRLLINESIWNELDAFTASNRGLIFAATDAPIVDRVESALEWLEALTNQGTPPPRAFAPWPTWLDDSDRWMLALTLDTQREADRALIQAWLGVFFRRHDASVRAARAVAIAADVARRFGVAFESWRPAVERLVRRPDRISSELLRRLARLLAGGPVELPSAWSEELVRERTEGRGNESFREVRPGSELARLLPSEWVQRRHPSLRRLFLTRWLAGQTLMLSGDGPSAAPKPRSRLILAIDGSASMMGGPDVLARRWALTLGLSAIESGVPVTTIVFSGHDESRTWVGTDEGGLWESLARTFDGDTSLLSAFGATRRIRDRTRSSEGATLLLLSDGRADVTDAVREACDELRAGGMHVLLCDVDRGRCIDIAEALGVDAVQLTEGRTTTFPSLMRAAY